MAMNASPDGTVVCNTKRKITLANAAARRMARVNPEGEPLDSAPAIWGDLFNPKGQRIPAEQWPWARALQGKTTIRREFRLAQAPREACDILFSAAPLRAFDGQIVGSVGVLTDITSHKRMEMRLQQQAVSRDRKRVAAEIHDTLLQDLSAIVLQLEAAESKFPAGFCEQIHQHVRRAQQITRGALTEARQSIWNLAESSHDTEELAPALSLVAEQLFADTAVKVEFSFSDGARKLWPETTLELLRIGKEALINVRKHAQANLVRIVLVCTSVEVELRVEDDGQGFRSNVFPDRPRGFGLIGMRSRAERLGGKIVVDSKPGQGTRVLALLPIFTEPEQRTAA